MIKQLLFLITYFGNPAGTAELLVHFTSFLRARDDGASLEDDSEMSTGPKSRLLVRVLFKFHITSVLKKLHTLPICFLAQFNVLILVFKALNDSGSNYLKKIIFSFPADFLRC